MKSSRGLVAVAALHATACTLLFDETQYLGGGAGTGGAAGAGGGVAACSADTCAPGSLPVYLASLPSSGGTQQKFDLLALVGKRITLKKNGDTGTQDCFIAWDRETVVLGCDVMVDAWYLLLELQVGSELVAHQFTASAAFTTSCADFACTGSQDDEGNGLVGVDFEVDGGTALIKLPVDSLGLTSNVTTFDIALEIGSTAVEAGPPAFFPLIANGSYEAKTQECSKPESCDK